MIVAIVDYGSGNLRSAAKAFERAARENEIRAEVEVTGSQEQLVAAFGFFTLKPPSCKAS